MDYEPIEYECYESDEDTEYLLDCGHQAPKRLAENTGGREVCRACFAVLRAAQRPDADERAKSLAAVIEYRLRGGVPGSLVSISQQ